MIRCGCETPDLHDANPEACPNPHQHNEAEREKEGRLETGVVRDGEDWPGIFIRGDNAFGFANALSRFLENPTDKVALGIYKPDLHRLVDLLRSSDIRQHAPTTQIFRHPDSTAEQRGYERGVREALDEVRGLRLIREYAGVSYTAGYNSAIDQSITAIRFSLLTEKGNCPTCHKPMTEVRPGKVQCDNCG